MLMAWSTGGSSFSMHGSSSGGPTRESMVDGAPGLRGPSVTRHEASRRGRLRSIVSRRAPCAPHANAPKPLCPTPPPRHAEGEPNRQSLQAPASDREADPTRRARPGARSGVTGGTGEGAGRAGRVPPPPEVARGGVNPSYAPSRPCSSSPRSDVAAVTCRGSPHVAHLLHVVASVTLAFRNAPAERAPPD
jgi:hypothetical protein